MRLDRTLSLYFFRPLVETGLVSCKRALPILMYHSISDDSESAVSPYYKTSTPSAVFEQHMRWLNEEGFRSVSLDEGLRIVRQKGLEHEKVVAITFDDGFRDFYDAAFPILRRHGHTATIFISTAFVGEKRRSFKNKECLILQEARNLRSQGIQFGSHTVNHPVLHELSWKEIENELAVSKEKLEAMLQEKITSFAYPYAFPQHDHFFAGNFRQLLQARGYQNCVTTVIGRVRTGDDALCLKRLPVNGCDDKALLLAKLSGHYDWLAYPQNWSKSTRRQLRCLFRKEPVLYPKVQSAEAFKSSPDSVL